MERRETTTSAKCTPPKADHPLPAPADTWSSVEVCAGANATAHGIDLAKRAASAECTILVTGETGVGKGRLSLWLHDNSPRREGSFIPVNCGAIPEDIIDSQLFGHARGAFSGATREHIGLVRAAQHGTLFLDEISELPPSAQTRLLRLLQEQEVQPVGHPRPVSVSVRVVAATNLPLDELVEAKAFRQDLLYRLNVIQLHVKPLRERTEEIIGLVDSFNREFAALYRQSSLEIDRQASKLLCAYHWPGNIRQLRTVIERLHVLCPGQRVTVQLLFTVGQLVQPGQQSGNSRSMNQVKVEAVRRVLAEAGGSISRAADVFGVHRSTIYRWLTSR